jgi:hypothetical protein
MEFKFIDLDPQFLEVFIDIISAAQSLPSRELIIYHSQWRASTIAMVIDYTLSASGKFWMFHMRVD